MKRLDKFEQGSSEFEEDVNDLQIQVEKIQTVMTIDLEVIKTQLAQILSGLRMLQIWKR